MCEVFSDPGFGKRLKCSIYFCKKLHVFLKCLGKVLVELSEKGENGKSDEIAGESGVKIGLVGAVFQLIPFQGIHNGFFG